MSLLDDQNDLIGATNNYVPSAHADPADKLKGSIFGFFTERVSKIKEKEQVMHEVMQSILEDLPNMETPEKLAVYNTLARDVNTSSEQITGIFKPSPGSPSPLAGALAPPPDSENERLKDAIGQLPPEKIKEIDKIIQSLSDPDSL